MDLDDFLSHMPTNRTRRSTVQLNNEGAHGQGACVGSSLEQHIAPSTSSAISRIPAELNAQSLQDLKNELNNLIDENQRIKELCLSYEEKSGPLRAQIVKIKQQKAFYEEKLSKIKTERDELNLKIFRCNKNAGFFDIFRENTLLKLNTAQDVPTIPESLDELEKEAENLTQNWMDINNEVTNSVISYTKLIKEKFDD